MSFVFVGAPDGGDVGMGTTAGDYASAAAGAVGSTVGAIFGAINTIDQIRYQQGAYAEGRESGMSSMLDDMARQQYFDERANAERDAINEARRGIASEYSAQERELAEEISREQAAAFAREAQARVGGTFGGSRPTPMWVWAVVGVGVTGVVIGGVWLVSKMKD
jgi:hypothetical protein